MPLMSAELYDALLDIGVDPVKARAAAEAAALPNRELAEIRADVAAIRATVAGHEGRFNMLMWMLGINLSLTLLILGKLFIFAGKP
jgi:hypothetical protein